MSAFSYSLECCQLSSKGYKSTAHSVPAVQKKDHRVNVFITKHNIGHECDHDLSPRL